MVIPMKNRMKEMMIMSEIRRVPIEVSGVPDGVELQANCAVSRYRTRHCSVIGIKGTPRVYPCRIMASFTNTTMSISVPHTAFSVTVRLDEVMAVLKEASDYHHDLEESKENAEKFSAQER